MIKKIIAIIFMIFCFATFVYYSIDIANKIKNVKINEVINIELQKTINYSEDIEEYTVNFEELKSKNTDTVAYLKVNNTKIDYVVVKGEDNNYYLTHNFNKEANSAGWIFADYKNKFDGTDRNIVIYGHNMLNGSMFGTLKNARKKEWYENSDNLIISLVTEKGNQHYKIFSIYTVKNEDYYIKTEFSDTDEFKKFISTIASRSIKKFDYNLEEIEQILTLSTCSGNGKNRFVVHAVKID